MAAEIQQAVERVLNALGIAGADTQDLVDNRLVLLRSLPLKITHATRKGEDRSHGVVVAHDCSPEPESRLAACSRAFSIA